MLVHQKRNRKDLIGFFPIYTNPRLLSLLLLQIIDEWRKKCDDLAAELDAAQRDARNLATDLFRAKTVQDELGEALEGYAY